MPRDHERPDHEVPEPVAPGTRPVKPEGEAKMLVAGMLAAPVAWLIHLAVSFSIVRGSCESGAWWVHHVVAAAALALALPGGWAALKEWRETPKEEDPAPRGRHRTHFLAIAGIVNSAFFSLIIIIAWAAVFIVPPCSPP